MPGGTQLIPWLGEVQRSLGMVADAEAGRAKIVTGSLPSADLAVEMRYDHTLVRLFSGTGKVIALAFQGFEG